MSAISTAVRLEQLRADATASGDVALFDRLIREGKTPEAAAMYACQQAPGAKNTDRAFCQGQRSKMENMSPMLAKMLRDRAKKAGIDVGGKYYIGGLADRGKGPTDPAAWVSCAEDVLTIAKAKNLQVDGVLNRTAIAKEHKPSDVKLAPDIVSKLARKAVAADPALAEKCRKNKHAVQELKEKLVERHTHRKPGRQSSLTRLLKSSR
jgi:hypothetical protein